LTEVMPKPPVRPEHRVPVHRGRINRCGHCRSGHCKSCRGAIRVPKTAGAPSGLVVCYCPNCDPQVRCLDCGNQFADDVNPEKWKCRDGRTCRGRKQQQLQNSRLWRLIQECKTAGALARRNDRDRRETVRLQVGVEPEDRIAGNRAPRPTKGSCECCGDPTKGGKFAPGHDARHKSKLKKASGAGDKDAYKELVERGWA
jgi:hypothetical protein